jgi:hypothetical protein
MSTPVVLYQSAAFTDAKPAGERQQKFPLPPQSPQYLAAPAYDQEFEILLTSFPPAAQNTLMKATVFNQILTPDPNAVLCVYSQPANTGRRMGKFKATFAVVPASWDDFVSQEWTPPGWIGSLLGAADYTARNEIPQEATVRVHHDYFIVDPNGLTAGIKDSAGNTIVAAKGTDDLINGNTAAKSVTLAGAIPIIPKTYFCNTVPGSGTPAFESHTTSLTPTGGYNGVYVQTFPTVENYIVWVNNVTGLYAAGTNPWTSLVWNGENLSQTQSQVGQIILKESVVKPYLGNIWERTTTYALMI